MKVGIAITAKDGTVYKTESIVVNDVLLGFIIHEDSTCKIRGNYYLGLYDIDSIKPCTLTH